jgi:hypothetical protein
LPKQDSETTAKQREALRQKLKELEVQPQTVASTPATPAATTPAPVTTSTPAEPAPAALTTAATDSAPPQADAEQKRRAADEANARRAAEKQAKSQAYASRKTAAAGTETTFQPIAGPPLPLSADKQAQLTELLRKYRADEITPEQYHEERAKIVGTQ